MHREPHRRVTEALEQARDISAAARAARERSEQIQLHRNLTHRRHDEAVDAETDAALRARLRHPRR